MLLTFLSLHNKFFSLQLLIAFPSWNTVSPSPLKDGGGSTKLYQNAVGLSFESFQLLPAARFQNHLHSWVSLTAAPVSKIYTSYILLHYKWVHSSVASNSEHRSSVSAGQAVSGVAPVGGDGSGCLLRLSSVHWPWLESSEGLNGVGGPASQLSHVRAWWISACCWEPTSCCVEHVHGMAAVFPQHLVQKSGSSRRVFHGLVSPVTSVTSPLGCNVLTVIVEVTHRSVDSGGKFTSPSASPHAGGHQGGWPSQVLWNSAR